MSEGTVVKWHKREGDKVKAGEEIADVETDKAVMPMEAFESGTLVHKSFIFPEWWVYAGMPPVLLVLLGVYLRWLARPPAHAGTREVV
jgi:hypothetical protein